MNTVVGNNNAIESNLFNGYTWQGWLTMIICFLGATANIFHVSFCIVLKLIDHHRFGFTSYNTRVRYDIYDFILGDSCQPKSQFG